MVAFIFAAGLGTRLQPFTLNHPKALFPVGGKPLLQHCVERLKQVGVTDVVVNVHHFADQIVDFLRANDNFGVRIYISDERNRLLDTGGAIRHAARFFVDGRPFLIHNVDILTNVDLNAFYADFIGRSTPPHASLLMAKRPSSRQLLFDASDRLCGWQNVSSGEVKSPYEAFDASRYTPYAFSGVHLFSPSLIADMEFFGDRFSIIDFYLSVCRRREVVAYAPEGLRVLDVGKVDAVEQAERFLLAQ